MIIRGEFMEENLQEISSESVKEKNKEKRKYYASYIWKFGLALWPVMIIYSILGNGLTYINMGGYIPSWLMYLLAYGVGLVFVYVFITIFSSVFDKDRVSESNEVYGEFGQKRKLGFGWFIVILLAMIFMGCVLRIVGYIVTIAAYMPAIVIKVIMILESGAVADMQNELDALTGNTASGPFETVILCFCTCVLAPIFEEIVFRKHLMDRLSKYGVSGAIIVSGLFFGLYHLNPLQFFFATMLGIVFGYVYAYTHNIVYTILLHFFYNLFVAGVSLINSLFISDKFKNEVSQAYNQLQAWLENSNNVNLSISNGLERFYDAVGRAILNHPISTFFVGLNIIWFLFYRLLILAGLVLFFVFMKRFFKMRKTLCLSEKGTKRSAVFNWASIVFLAVGLAVSFLVVIIATAGILLA